jgi:dynein heavy chain
VDIIKVNAKDLLRNLENCIRFGKVLVIINVGEEIDPSLSPVLDR